jgi:quinoprotein glucose dehydrogenase
MVKQLLTVLCLLGLARCSQEPATTDGADAGQWQHAGGSHFSEKYAGLDQIDADNFSDLEVAWRWQSIDAQLPAGIAYPTGDYRAVPLYVNGIIYTNTNHGQVVALDPATGELLWSFDPQSYRHGRPNFNPLMTRGIEYWSDGDIERIFYSDSGQAIGLH